MLKKQTSVMDFEINQDGGTWVDKVLFPDNISATVTYITLYIQALKNNHWLLSGGLRYHISNIKVRDEKTQLSLNIGLGYNF